MRRVYREFTGLEHDYARLVSDKKRLVIGTEMAGDVNNLAMTIKRAFGHFRHGRDITLYGLRRAIVEVLANFPVYRTYFDRGHAREEDAAYLAQAVDKACERLPAMANEFAFLKELFLAGPDDFRDAREYDIKLDTVMRFQQYSGPLMAKGFEDTVLYVYNRLLALNEVGGSPDEFGLSLSRFHAVMRERSAKWPRSMSATATHDAKRGEDARARLAVLSEMPGEWRARIREWRRMNRARKRRVEGRSAPDANDEYFLYQTLLAAWSYDETDAAALAVRLEPLLIKSLREAKVHTSWTRPDEEYEAAALGFLRGALADQDFVAALSAFRDKIALPGALNSLSQTLIKLAAPGVPDFYQGCELWDFSLVDPDNRRPVDFDKRRGLLHALGAKKPSPGLCRELLEHYPDGRVKLYLIMRGLAARRENPALFARGDYAQVRVVGRRKDNVVAFARRLDRRGALAVVPRFTSELIAPEEFPMGSGVWGDTRLELPGNAPRQWIDAVSGEQVSSEEGLQLAKALKCLPVCLLLGGV
jgi:(1->4)-alpha-D-glucan 1-alpha-D-glucosylmutase